MKIIGLSTKYPLGELENQNKCHITFIILLYFMVQLKLRWQLETESGAALP